MNDRVNRIKQVIETLGLTKHSLANLSKIAPPNLNKMLIGEQTITDRTLHKIASTFPQINLEWLKTGEGEMLNPGSPKTQTVESGIGVMGNVGHDVMNNSEKLFKDFILGLQAQNALTEKALSQTGKSLETLQKSIDNMAKSIEGNNLAMQNTNQVITEMSEQRKIIDRLVSILEKK